MKEKLNTYITDRGNTIYANQKSNFIFSPLLNNFCNYDPLIREFVDKLNNKEKDIIKLLINYEFLTSYPQPYYEEINVYIEDLDKYISSIKNKFFNVTGKYTDGWLRSLRKEKTIYYYMDIFSFTAR